MVFWVRDKLKYSAEVYPSDILVSRCFREIKKRLLNAQSMWAVKSLLHQVTSMKIQRKVGAELWTWDDEDPEVTSSFPEYLALLFTYLLALAIVGAERVVDQPTEAESMGSGRLASLLLHGG